MLCILAYTFTPPGSFTTARMWFKNITIDLAAMPLLGVTVPREAFNCSGKPTRCSPSLTLLDRVTPLCRTVVRSNAWHVPNPFATQDDYNMRRLPNVYESGFRPSLHHALPPQALNRTLCVPNTRGFVLVFPPYAHDCVLVCSVEVSRTLPAICSVWSFL